MKQASVHFCCWADPSTCNGRCWSADQSCRPDADEKIHFISFVARAAGGKMLPLMYIIKCQSKSADDLTGTSVFLNSHTAAGFRVQDGWKYKTWTKLFEDVEKGGMQWRSRRVWCDLPSPIIFSARNVEHSWIYHELLEQSLVGHGRNRNVGRATSWALCWRSVSSRPS